MQAPSAFRYSPNGYHIVAVAQGEEMSAEAAAMAKKLGLIGKRGDGQQRKARPPHANKATGPDFNK